MAQLFRLDRVSKSPAVFDEQKLRHMNGRYLRDLSLDELTARLEQFTGRTGLRGAVEISREKIQTLADFWPLAGFLIDGPIDDQRAFQKVIGADGGPQLLASARQALVDTDPFTVENIEASLRQVVESRGLKPGQVFQPVRVAIAGTTVSPGIFESVALLGKERTLSLVDDALARTA
jgi:glutamyl-tRNA synthetase